MHYYQFNIGNYRRQTHHLTVLEHGVYRMLLDTYYLDEKPLCKDKAKLMRTHNVRSQDEQEAFENVISDFFELTDAGYVHETCEEKIAKYQEKAEKASKSAKARWDKDASAMRAHSEGNANQEPITNNQQPPTPSADAPEGGDRIEYKKIADLFNEILGEHLPKCRDVTAARKRSIKARINEDSKRESLDWWRAYFEVVRDTDGGFLLGRGPPRPDTGKPWRPDFEWFIKQDNMVKVIEGKYE